MIVIHGSLDARVLRTAKALIPDEAHWWRGEGDKRKSRCHCPITAIFAAVLKIGGNAEEDTAHRAFAEAAGVPVGGIMEWNDNQATFAELHCAFDRAIAAAEARA